MAAEVSERTEVSGETVRDAQRDGREASADGHGGVTKTCSTCRQAFSGPSFGAVMGELRRHRRQEHPEPEKARRTGEGRSPQDDEPAAAGGSHADETPAQAVFREALGKVITNRAEKWVIDLLVSGAADDPGILQAPDELAQILEAHGLVQRQVRGVLSSLFGLRAAWYSRPRPPEPPQAPQAAAQAAAQGEAMAMALESVAAAVAALGGRGGVTDREASLQVQLAKVQEELKRKDELTELRSEFAAKIAALAPENAQTSKEFGNLRALTASTKDVLPEVKGLVAELRQELRLASAPLVAAAMKQGGMSDTQITQTLAGYAGPARPVNTSPEAQRARERWLKAGGAEPPAPQESGAPIVLQLPVLPAPSWPATPPGGGPVTGQPVTLPRLPDLPPLPSWPFTATPVATAQPDPVAVVATACDCGAVKTWPQGAWNVIERHFAYCSWRRSVTPPDNVKVVHA